MGEFGLVFGNQVIFLELLCTVKDCEEKKGNAGEQKHLHKASNGNKVKE